MHSAASACDGHIHYVFPLPGRKFWHFADLIPLPLLGCSDLSVF